MVTIITNRKFVLENQNNIHQEQPKLDEVIEEKKVIKPAVMSYYYNQNVVVKNNGMLANKKYFIPQFYI